MNVKGFILEDDQGREFVVVCEQPYLRSAKTFALRGWHRRRLVPLQSTERELRQIVAEVLLTLNDLFKSLPKFWEGKDEASSDKTSSPSAHVSKTMGEAEGNHVMN